MNKKDIFFLTIFFVIYGFEINCSTTPQKIESPVNHRLQKYRPRNLFEVLGNDVRSQSSSGQDNITPRTEPAVFEFDKNKEVVVENVARNNNNSKGMCCRVTASVIVFFGILTGINYYAQKIFSGDASGNMKN